MTSEALHDYLSQRFSEWSNISIRNLQDITSGWETKIISFDIEFSSSESLEQRSWIARAYPGTPGVERSSFEFELLHTLHTLDYPVPNVILLETDAKWLGKPFIIMDRIDGTTMWEAMESGGENVTNEMVQELGHLFVRLHNTDWSKASQVPKIYYETSPRDMYLRNIEGVRDWIAREGIEFLVPLSNWLEDNYSSIEFERYSLLHGDFHPMNILIDSRGVSYVIDWTAAKLGDYRSDLAWSLMLAFLHWDEKFSGLILESYEAAAGFKVPNIDYFIVEASIRRFSDVFLSMRDGAETMGMLEGTAEAMLSSLPLMTKLHDLIEPITGFRIMELDEYIERISHTL